MRPDPYHSMNDQGKYLYGLLVTTDYRKPYCGVAVLLIMLITVHVMNNCATFVWSGLLVNDCRVMDSHTRVFVSYLYFIVNVHEHANSH